MLLFVKEFIAALAHTLPLEVYIFIGAILEELIAPIPSPLVMSLAGTLANAQGWGIWYLLFLSLIGSASKTGTTMVFYVLADKAEDIIVPRFGKFLGVTHEDLEHFGQHFKGEIKDIIILAILRSIPVMPSLPISLACGIVKLPITHYLLATFCGFYLRDLFFIVLGYTGFAAYESYMQGLDSAEYLMKILIVGGIILLLGWLYYCRRKGHPAHWIKRR